MAIYKYIYLTRMCKSNVPGVPPKHALLDLMQRKDYRSYITLR